MTRLGSVLGGILAELARAQAISDQLTRELVEEYQDDPVLSTLAVPRVTLSDVDVTLRFTVEEVEEPPTSEPDVEDIRARLSRGNGKKLLTSAVSGFRLNREDQAKYLEIVKETGTRHVGVPTNAALTRAVEGSASKAVDMMVKPALEAWEKLPADLRRRIGSKDVYSLNLKRAFATHLDTVIKNARSTADAKTALGSRIRVTVTREELPDDPGKVQELRLTLRSGDLDLVVSEFTGGSDGNKEG